MRSLHCRRVVREVLRALAYDRPMSEASNYRNRRIVDQEVYMGGWCRDIQSGLSEWMEWWRR